MSKLFPGSYKATAVVAAMPLVLCALVPWFARAERVSTPAVGVVDAFVNARAARDVNGVAAVLDEDAQVVDSSRDRTTGIEGLYQLLPLGETVEFGPRTQTQGGEVTWTETVVQTDRPSWENNLNWWMDGNGALEAEVSTSGMGAAPAASGPQTGESGPVATSDTRTMRAIVTEGRITRLTMTRGASLESSISGSGGLSQTTRMLALVATVALLGCVLVGSVAPEPTARPASDRGWLVQGLEGWLAVRRGREPS